MATFLHRLVDYLTRTVDPATINVGDVPAWDGEEFVPGPGGSGGLPSWFQSGSGSPVGVVTPTQQGALYQDTANGALYEAIGATNADWVNYLKPGKGSALEVVGDDNGLGYSFHGGPVFAFRLDGDAHDRLQIWPHGTIALGIGTASPENVIQARVDGSLTILPDNPGELKLGSINSASAPIRLTNDEKLGFYGAAPGTRPAAIANATDPTSTQDRLNDLLAALRTLGLIAP